jgi:hypothetical protein
MVTKHSNSIVDKLLESVYTETIVKEPSYEKNIVEIMIDLDCTISEALDIDFDMNGVDKSSVVDLVDYLEMKVNRNMDTVNMLMQIYTHQTSDFKLKPLL